MEDNNGVKSRARSNSARVLVFDEPNDGRRKGAAAAVAHSTAVQKKPPQHQGEKRVVLFTNAVLCQALCGLHDSYGGLMFRSLFDRTINAECTVLESGEDPKFGAGQVRTIPLREYGKIETKFGRAFRCSLFVFFRFAVGRQCEP